MSDDMDINGGTIADGLETVTQVGERIVARVIALASGEMSKSEALGHQEFALHYKTYEPIGPSCLPR
jgi:altronate hydrolase